MSDNKITLPSQHQIDDEVYFTFGSMGVMAQVIGVHFYPGKVQYDLWVIPEEDESRSFPISNIDSSFVTKLHL